MLRGWRRARRERLAPHVAKSWARTDSLPRGSDAGFAFQNVGPLVGCPPSLWLYFVGGRADPEEGASPALDEEAAGAAARDARRLFERACDTMLSYALLTSSAGYLREPLPSPDEQRDDAGEPGAAEAEVFRAPDVFARYDVVVALDEQTRERIAAQAGGESKECRRLCCLTDFLDVCGEAEQLEQLDRLLGPSSAPSAAAKGRSGVRGQTLSSLTAERAISRARRVTDLPVGSPRGATDLAVRALCVAGLERFLIAQFPAHLKDRLHPYLVPEGLR